VLCKWFYLLLVWGPTGAEDRGQIKSQLGEVPVRLKTILLAWAARDPVGCPLPGLVV